MTGLLQMERLVVHIILNKVNICFNNLDYFRTVIRSLEESLLCLHFEKVTEEDMNAADGMQMVKSNILHRFM